jgi:hypothetical protein
VLASRLVSKNGAVIFILSPRTRDKFALQQFCIERNYQGRAFKGSDAELLTTLLFEVEQLQFDLIDFEYPQTFAKTLHTYLLQNINNAIDCTN